MVVLGIDIGGTNIKTMTVSPQGEILHRSAIATEGDLANWPERVRRRVEEVEREIEQQVLSIGLAAPGLAARDGRSIAWMQGRLESVQGVDWTEVFDRGITIPVLNDAHAALLGEVWLGGAQGFRDVLMLTLGTGVGGAVLTDGRLLRGHLGRAGHLGHISLDPNGSKDIVGTPGSLEELIGECTLSARSGGRFQTTAQLLRAADAGDREAEALWQRSVHALACGIVSLINAFDPEVVLLGGGIVQAGDRLFQPLERWLDAYEWRPTGNKVRLRAASLGEWAGAAGAAWSAMQTQIQ